MSRLRQLMAGVRVRTTVAAVLVVGAALVIASAGMVVQLRTLTENIRDAAEITATSIADTIAQDELRHVIPGGEDDEFVQVIDPEDGVVASTANLPDPRRWWTSSPSR